MTYDEIIDYIEARAIDDGHCWIWQGSKDSKGRPVMRLKGSRKLVAVRRVLLEAKGVTFTAKSVASTKCGNPLCVNPDHAARLTRRQLILRAAKTTGYANRPSRNEAIAMAKRKNSPFTPEMIKEILESPESGHAIARRLGHSQSTIQAIRAREVWKDYRNPFAGLGAR